MHYNKKNTLFINVLCFINNYFPPHVQLVYVVHLKNLHLNSLTAVWVIGETDLIGFNFVKLPVFATDTQEVSIKSLTCGKKKRVFQLYLCFKYRPF